MGRSPCGERELKKRFGGYRPNGYGRSPCGKRELKYQLTKEKSQWTLSLPIRRGRIENTEAHDAKRADYVAPHTGSEN